MVGWQLRSPCFKGAAYGLDFGLRVAASGYRCCGGLGVGCSKVVSICSVIRTDRQRIGKRSLCTF